MAAPLNRNSTSSSLYAAAVAIGVIGSLYFMREILIPVAFALTLTFLLSPVVAFLERLRLGRVLSVVLTMLVTIAIAGWGAWAIGNQIIDVVNQFPTYRDNIHTKVQSLSLSQKSPLSRAAASVKEIGQELSSAGKTAPPPVPAPVPQRQIQKRVIPASPDSPVPVQIVEPSANTFTYLRDLSASVLRPIALTGIVIIFTIFMLLEREDLRNRVLRLAGLSQLNVMTQALDDAAKRVSRYLMMQFAVNLGFALVIGTGLYLIGLPTPALWGVLGGLLRIVPYAGTLVAAGLPLVLSLAVFNGWSAPLLVFLLFAVVELMVGNFLEPWLYGTHTGVSSLALLVAAVFWTILWGPAGLVLSTPLTVCVVVLGRYIPALGFLHILLGDEPVLAAEAHFYQRLLAMDQQEARAVADLFLKTNPVIELYDRVLIPALSLAEQDRHRSAIDAAREEFLFMSVNEMVVELSDRDKPQELAATPHAEFRRVICLPAHDEADEIVAGMLAQILEQQGCGAIIFPAGSPLRETLGTIDINPADIVCISALPPYAFAPARSMCKQLRSRFPEVTIIVSIWGFAGDSEKASTRFENCRPKHLVTSLAQTVEVIRQLNGPPDGDQPVASDSSAGAKA